VHFLVGILPVSMNIITLANAQQTKAVCNYKHTNKNSIRQKHICSLKSVQLISVLGLFFFEETLS
jgi:hypothetical protein